MSPLKEMAMDIDQMSVLDRRSIEAEILAPMYRAFVEELGEARVKEIMGKAVVAIAYAQGKALADRKGANDLKSFAASKEPWTRNGALELEVLEENDRAFSYNVTRCRYAEMYRQKGIPELGAILSCGRDYALPHGFNPNIRLTRTQTIKQGASYCDFTYESNERNEDSTNVS